MIQRQRHLELVDERKPIIISNNLENGWVKTVDEALKGQIKALEKAPFTTIHTLGNLAMDKVYVINEEYLKDADTLEKPFAFLKALKEEALIVSESFKEETLPLIFETIVRTLYDFNTYKQEKPSVSALYYLVDPSNETLIDQGLAIGDAVNETRELINTPYNYLNAETLAEKALEWGKKDGIEATVLDKKAIEKLSMGAFLGVNAGSKDAPKLIHLTYRGMPAKESMVALVGKGVMYDTGGYSLKTPQSMPSMKMDMGGAATVLGAFKALHSLKAEINVSVIIAATDNRIGDQAIVPDDILTSAQGTTIEIVSTDAEGRLTLADALWYAQKNGATHLIDVATLTGSVVAALGDKTTGVFSNDDAFYNSLEKGAQTSKESIWRLPIMPPHRKALESYSADMANKGGRMAGASIAAAFLEHFVEDGMPWLHLDIAGTAYNQKNGATGVMVRTLVNMFL